jgi:hypothetical protein
MKLGIRSHPTTPNRARRAGVALLSVLAVLTGLLVLLATFQHATVRRTAETSASIDERRAFHLAETALNEGMVALRAGSTGAVGTVGAPAYFGGGVFWVDATDLGSAQTRLTATALSGSGRAALEAVVVIHSQEPLFSSVLNSKEPLHLASGVVVDSYASAAGTYASQASNTYNGYGFANDNGDVSSNSDIMFASGATVFGDATPGPGHTCSFSSGTYVSGSTAAAPEPFAFPPIRVPSTPIAGALAVPENGSSTLSAGNYGFTDVSIGRGAKLMVQGPATIVCTNFTGEMYANLEIDAVNGPVTFYIQGSYTHVNRFEATSAVGSPMALAFMINTAGSLGFPPNAKLRGAYYAPNADVQFTSGIEVWGAFAANRISMAANTRFHYDESLMDHWNNAGPGGDPLEVLVWRRAPVTPHALTIDRRDPYTVLGVERAALLSPADSWIDA